MPLYETPPGHAARFANAVIAQARTPGAPVRASGAAQGQAGSAPMTQIGTGEDGEGYTLTPMIWAEDGGTDPWDTPTMRWREDL